jgi:hypothetical protein
MLHIGRNSVKITNVNNPCPFLVIRILFVMIVQKKKEVFGLKNISQLNGMELAIIVIDVRSVAV